MIKIKRTIIAAAAACIIFGTAAGAVAVKISRNVRDYHEICVVVDAGHGATA